MAATLNINSSNIGKIDTLASVPHGSETVINLEKTTIKEMRKGLIERDETPEKALATLLEKLGIQDDQEKLKAFQDLVNSLKKPPIQNENERKEKVKESSIFRLLGKTESVLGLLSSAATIYSALTQ